MAMTEIEQHPDVSFSSYREHQGIHAVIPTEEKILNGFVSHIDTHMVALGFGSKKDKGDGIAFVQRVEDPERPGVYITELAIAQRGAIQRLVRIAPIDGRGGLEVSFFDRSATNTDSMVPIDLDLKRQGAKDIPQPVVLGDSSKDNRHTRYAERELRYQAAYAVNRAVGTMVTHERRFQEKKQGGSAIPMSEDWNHEFALAQHELAADLQRVTHVVYNSTSHS